MSSFNPEASRSYNIQYQHTKADRFRQLLRALESDDYRDLFHQLRVPAGEGDCVGNLLQGYRWYGKRSMTLKHITASQLCMDNCDNQNDCVGWTYNSQNKICRGYSSIGGVIPGEHDLSGSCVGKNLKQPCIDERAGEYALAIAKTETGVESAEECRKKCDELDICYAWVYSASDKNCRLGRAAGEFHENNDLFTGTCMAQQIRTRPAEPMKLFRKEALERHNFLRKQHCAPNLALDDALNTEAQALATKLAEADVSPPVYEEPTLRNVLYDKADEARSADTIVDCFYDQKKYYKWNEPNLAVTKAFPKVIWKGSTRLGVGRAFTNDKQTMFVTMIYDWQGNMADALKDNVQQTCSK